MRRAKIVCTLGPASESQAAIEELIRAGLDVARLNFSHGDHDFHRMLVNRVRAAAGAVGKPVAIMQDLQGPKIRCLKMENGAVFLEEGKETIITIDDILGTAERFGTLYKLLPKDVHPGEQVLLDDGNLTLEVIEKDDRDVRCKIIHGGILKDKKGINLPNSDVSAPSMTEKDIRDAHFGAEVGVDAVALSFVRTRADVRMLRRELAHAKSRPLIIAKLEKPQAIDELEGIIEESDGVMVARGDLGVEMPTERVPILQKLIVEEANRRGKIVIVATQMLESMITNPRPTRAEASDVANAVLDVAGPALTSAFADELSARAIVCYSTSGNTARLISDYRSSVPVIALVPSPVEQRRLAFSWGIQSEVIEPLKHSEELFLTIDRLMLGNGTAREGDVVVVITKLPLSSKQRSNTMHLHVVGTAAHRVV